MTSNLRLVKFDSSDFSLAEVLNANSGTTFTDSQKIASILSLYFQWPEHRKAVALVNNIAQEVNILYDADEAIPSMFWFPIIAHFDVQPTFLKLYIELFNVCYELHVKCIDSVINENEEVVLYFEPPDKITVLKSRGLPRHKLRERAHISLYTASGQAVEGELLEVGLSSFICRTEDVEPKNLESLFINDLKLSIKFLRSTANASVFTLALESKISVEKYFLFYLKHRFPSLRPRGSVPHEKVFKTYVESGFLKKYEKNEGLLNDNSALHSELSQTWQNLSDAQFEHSLDLVSVLEKNNTLEVVGASSVFLCYFEKEKPVWAFHQLCALKDPDTIKNTTDLYMWRADYLYFRNESLKACAWFNSRSRWIERIWVKFANNSPKNCELKAISMKVIESKNLHSRNLTRDIQSKKYNIGSATRVSLESENFFGACSPPRINASGAMDFISISFQPEDYEQYINTIFRESQSINYSMQTIRAQFDIGEVPASLQNLPDHGSDRFCIFTRESLPTLSSSILHAMAVYQKKHGAT